VDLVLAEILLLGRHLAIAAMTDGLLQLCQQQADQQRPAKEAQG